MQRVMAEGIEVRIEDGYPADRSTDFLRGPDRHRGALMLWRKALHHVAAAADIDRHFTAGFILDDGRMAMTADGADGSVVCINPDRFREAIKKYGKEPLSLAAFLHGVACHELAHLDGRMGNGHDEEFIAAREDLGASTAHTIPQIAELAACTLGLGPCNVEPTKYEAARQEAIRACEPAVTGQEASWTSGDLCQAAADPLAPMVASFVDHLLELRPGGLSRDYIEGFALRHEAQLRSAVTGLSAGRDTGAQRIESLPAPRASRIHDAKVARVVAAIRANLGPHVLRSDWRKRRPVNAAPSWGCCYVASEAAYHALGGAKSGLRVMHVAHEGAPHWYLTDADGRVIDPTADQFSSPVPYVEAKGKGFLTTAPSKRASSLLAAAGLSAG